MKVLISSIAQKKIVLLLEFNFVYPPAGLFLGFAL